MTCLRVLPPDCLLRRAAKGRQESAQFSLIHQPVTPRLFGFFPFLPSFFLDSLQFTFSPAWQDISDSRSRFYASGRRPSESPFFVFLTFCCIGAFREHSRDERVLDKCAFFEESSTVRILPFSLLLFFSALRPAGFWVFPFHAKTRAAATADVARRSYPSHLWGGWRASGACGSERI